MATISRGRPYIWVTHITAALSGDKHCLFSPWFRAHFRYDGIPDTNFNRAAWTADHTAMVQQRASELRAEGWTVRLEGENAFRFHGRNATLGGKPDIVAMKPGQALVVDCKTGKQRHSDYFQVLIYMLALPRCFDDLNDVRLTGEVCYRQQRLQVQPEELNEVRREQIFALLRSIGGDVRQTPTPSADECAQCDIPSADCSARVAPDLVAEAMAGAGEF